MRYTSSSPSHAVDNPVIKISPMCSVARYKVPRRRNNSNIKIIYHRRQCAASSAHMKIRMRNLPDPSDNRPSPETSKSDPQSRPDPVPNSEPSDAVPSPKQRSNRNPKSRRRYPNSNPTRRPIAVNVG